MRMHLFLCLGLGLLGTWMGTTFAQMSTDPGLCGGYMRDVRGHIDFTFNENTAPPDVAQRNKICMWTISPTVPSQNFRYNITIRNVNLDCSTGKDWITVNFFNESSDNVNLGYPQQEDKLDLNPFCADSHVVWQRNNAAGTTMVVILYVSQVTYGKGFYMSWEEGFESWITPSRVRNTYYSFGRPSVAPLPYFAANFLNNEISTFGLVKANYTDGYVMEISFDSINYCSGPGSQWKCFNNTMTVYSIDDSGILTDPVTYINNTENTPARTSTNGFFIIAKGQDMVGAGGKFVLQFDTIRG